jgi:hypothetical protein
MKVVAQAYMNMGLTTTDTDREGEHSQAVAFCFLHAFQIVLTESNTVSAAT